MILSPPTTSPSTRWFALRRFSPRTLLTPGAAGARPPPAVTFCTPSAGGPSFFGSVGSSTFPFGSPTGLSAPLPDGVACPSAGGGPAFSAGPGPLADTPADWPTGGSLTFRPPSHVCRQRLHRHGSRRFRRRG